mmetsp:Transcript_9420/g.13052  ORF Transcript_9420/g.13052 Transcript_9420/m.13052 type:complete len:194 (-) Transcript_9420:120-701(-)
MFKIWSLTIIVLIKPVVATSCGTCGVCSSDEDCQNLDYGSCGNACCKLDVNIALSYEEVVETLNSSLTAGGPDGQFSASVLAEGVSGFADLRPYNHSVFIGQFIHETAGSAHYNDSISLTVGTNDDGSSALHLFSYSLIGGAYGDAGQNYKNLKLVLGALDSDHAEITHSDTSCPDPYYTKPTSSFAKYALSH